MSKDQSRWERLHEGIEAERAHEEAFFKELSESKSVKEKIAAGVLWYPVSITRKNYTVGEYVEVEVEPMTPSASGGSNGFRVGSSAVLFVNGHERHEYKGTISYATKKKVRITLSADLLVKEHVLDHGHIGVELIYDDRPYRIMLDSIDTVKRSTEPHIIELRQAINKQEIDQRAIDDFIVKKGDHYDALNESQQQAITQAIQVPRMAIIHGPPGTGKTTTLVELLNQILQHEKQVLVTAPSNNAVDLLASLLHQIGLSVVRVGNVTRMGDSISHLCIEEQVRDHKEWQHIKRVKIEAEKARREASRHKRKFGPKERQHRQNLYKEARQLNKWARDLESKLVENILSGAQVICSTLIGCAHPSISHMTFETVVIDEGSQALEAECWTAILRARRVIIAGDHMQLPPTVKSSKAISLQLNETILDRMSGHMDDSYLLHTQYRMHPTILGYSNQEYYDGRLQSDQSVLDRESQWADHPVVMIDTSGCGFDEMIMGDSRSKYNPQEYLMIREHILSIIAQLDGHSIGIISPYSAQVRHIRSQIEQDEDLRALDIEVNSIDGFQGQEKDVIYVSLVRSNDRGEVGFLSDARRLNVALTRARELLVVVGDMATLGADVSYMRLAEYIEQSGVYQSGWEYMGV